jgi:hypothetical protein
MYLCTHVYVYMYTSLLVLWAPRETKRVYQVNIFICIYAHMYMYICICIHLTWYYGHTEGREEYMKYMHIYIHEIDCSVHIYKGRLVLWAYIYIHICIYIYMTLNVLYIYIYIYIYTMGTPRDEKGI